MPVRIDLDNIDWQLLRKQKRQLVTMATLGRAVTGDDCETIEGILNLLDTIQDQAVDTGQVEDVEVFGIRFTNHYKCDHAGTESAGKPVEEWDDDSTYTNNDKCPVCHAEIEPYASEDIESGYML